MTSLTPPRAAWLTAALMMVGVWAAFSAGARMGAGTQTVVAPADGPAAGASVSLMARIRSPRERGPARVSRDPFRFTETEPRPSADAAALAQAAMQALAAAAEGPSSPRMALVGVAEARDGEASVFTAVINVDGDVVLARHGDVVAGRFRVVRISADAVSLEESGGGATRVLRLR